MLSCCRKVITYSWMRASGNVSAWTTIKVFQNNPHICTIHTTICISTQCRRADGVQMSADLQKETQTQQGQHDTCGVQEIPY